MYQLLRGKIEANESELQQLWRIVDTLLIEICRTKPKHSNLNFGLNWDNNSMHYNYISAISICCWNCCSSDLARFVWTVSLSVMFFGSLVDIWPWASTRYCRSVMELAVGVGWRGG